MSEATVRTAKDFVYALPPEQREGIVEWIVEERRSAYDDGERNGKLSTNVKDLVWAVSGTAGVCGLLAAVFIIAIQVKQAPDGECTEAVARALERERDERFKIDWEGPSDIGAQVGQIPGYLCLRGHDTSAFYCYPR